MGGYTVCLVGIYSVVGLYDVMGGIYVEWRCTLLRVYSVVGVYGVVETEELAFSEHGLS